MELHWDGGTKICSKFNGPSNVTKMAAVPIYGKTPLKIFSKTKRPMTLKLAIQHWGLGPDKIYLNSDPGLPMTFLQQGQICSLMLFMGKCFNTRFYGNY